MSHGVTRMGTHLAADAVVAFVDGELGGTASHRAVDHLSYCHECRLAVAAQRGAKRALCSCAPPVPSADFLSRLREIPFTASVTPPGASPDVTIAADGEHLMYGYLSSRPGPAAPAGPDPDAYPEATALDPPSLPGPGTWLRTARVGGHGGHLLRRGLLGVAASAALVGAVATVPIHAAPTTGTPTGTGVDATSSGAVGSPGGTATGSHASTRRVDDRQLFARLGGRSTFHLVEVGRPRP